MSRRLAALSCVAVLGVTLAAPVAIAQPAPSVQVNPIGVELSYEAFAGCPEREAFAKNLDARRRGAAEGVSAVQLDVRLRAATAHDDSPELPNRVEGLIVLRSANEVRSARRIVASTCGEAADALALIAALALQGIEVEEVPAPADDTDERSTGKRKDPSDNRGRRADRPRSSSAVDKSASEPPTVGDAETVGETQTVDETQRFDETQVVGETQATDERATEREAIDPRTGELVDPVEPVDASAERTSRAYLLVSGGLASGVLPELQPWPELSLSLEQGVKGALMWSAQVAFRISPNQTRHFDQGVVTFGWWTGLSALCLGARGSQLSASACATLEVGALSAAASDTDSPRDELRAWVALGPGLTFGYDVTPALRVQLRAELLTPLARYRLELPRGTAVHEPEALGLRAGLGAGLRLW